MYDSDDLDQELGLDLPRDDDTLESYEETPIADAADGYMVQNFRGFDIAVLGTPKDAGITMSGANPAHYASFEDDEYQAHAILSPRPMDFDTAFSLPDDDARVGTDSDGLLPDDYIELEERDQPGQAIADLMDDRDDFRDSAIERLGFYVLNEAEGPVGDDRATGIAAALSGDETVDPEVHERMQDLAHHYALDR
jgi:hypothetical protein